MRPEGAFYGFLEIGGLKDSLGFARMLVEHQNVGVSPGSTFGRDPRDDRFVRICFAQDAARVTEGLARLERGAAAL
jgi:aspartate/methionine/tyrosine aminotransferase